MRGWLIALVGLLGCDGGGPDFTYGGVAGTPVPVRIELGTPTIQAAVDGVEGRFLIDTGAPFSILDTDSFSDYADGKHRVALDAFGLSFFDYRVIALDALPFAMSDDPIDGIIGGDLLRPFALTIDYQGQRAWLREDFDGTLPDGLDATAIGDVTSAHAPVKGGGRYAVPGSCPGGCGTFELPATRVLVEVVVDGDPDPVWALVDTGATAVVISEPLLTRLGQSGRPRLDGVTVGTAAGSVAAYFTRLASVQLVGAGQPADRASVPALVIPGFDIFAAASDEVGREVELILGGSYLRHFATTFDYAGRALQLAVYADPDHVDPNEWVRPGFAVARVGGRWIAADVYPGTDAAAQGLADGDEIVAIDGTVLDGLDVDTVQGLLTGHPVGAAVEVDVARGSGVETVPIVVEDLLPHYPDPSGDRL